MILKFINKSTFIIVALITLVSCKNEIENIGVDFVGNQNFSTNSFTSEIIAYNHNVVKNRGEVLNNFLLGVYKDSNFGKIESSLASQLYLPTETYDYGLNPHIESVIIDIPYFSTKTSETNADGSPIFKLDSIIGDQTVDFKLEVFELGTYLTGLDPTNTTQVQAYYTNDSYQKIGTPLYSGTFKPNKNDTVMYLSRLKEAAGSYIEYDRDTIKAVKAAPSIKIPLDINIIKQKFLDNALSSDFSSNDLFNAYFRGLFFEATPLTITEASLLTLNLNAAKMTIYYSNDILKNEQTENSDLDGNGTIEDIDVPVRTKQQFDFSFRPIRNNKYIRDFTGAAIEPYLSNPDVINGEDKIFLQGAAGFDTVLTLFKNENIDDLRNKDWLINGANIYLYIDASSVEDIVPERLYIYEFDDSKQILDIFKEGAEVVSGKLAVDADGNSLNYYKFRITDFISKQLKKGTTGVIPKLGIKVFNPTDIPAKITDKIIQDRSWNPKGVVLKGNLPTTDSNRIKLEIFYSEIEN